jgi:hypothetical protein
MQYGIARGRYRNNSLDLERKKFKRADFLARGDLGRKNLGWETGV